MGVPGHDGAAAAVGDLARGGAAAGRALGQHHRVELAHPGPAARHHDVLPRLRAAAPRPATLMPTGLPTPSTGFNNLFLEKLAYFICEVFITYDLDRFDARRYVDVVRIDTVSACA